MSQQKKNEIKEEIDNSWFDSEIVEIASNIKESNDDAMLKQSVKPARAYKLSEYLTP